MKPLFFTQEQYEVLSALYAKRYGRTLAVDAQGDVDLTRTENDRSTSILYLATKQALFDALDKIIELENELTDKNNLIEMANDRW